MFKSNDFTTSLHTESTIKLNSSFGQLGDEILGETFLKEQSNRQSIATLNDLLKGDIGITNERRSEVVDPTKVNRVSVISANTASF